jgi:hypothetical protein
MISSLAPINYSELLTGPDPGEALTAGFKGAQADQLARAQLTRQLQQQQQLDAARQAAIANPNAANFNRLFVLDPQSHEAIKAAHDSMDKEQQDSALTELSAIRGLIAAGRGADAQARLQRHITADKAAGQDTSDDEQMLALIGQDPKAASAAIDYQLAGVMGPDKWESTFKTIGEDARANAAKPGQIAKTAAETALATQQTANLANPPPKTAAVAGALDASGNPIFYNENAAPPAGATGAAAGSPALSGFVARLQQTENATGDPSAKNPRSSAAGNGQFLNGTWLQMLKAERPDLAEGKSDAQLLALRSNPGLSAEITTAYAQQNATTLQAANLPVNGTTLAMAHKLGPAGAQAVLAADPSTPLAQVLPANVLAANPQLKGKTAGDYAMGLSRQFGTDPINTQADPNATGEDYLATLAPGKAKLIRSIANGDQPGPSGRNITSGAGQALMQQVLQYDPTASAINLDSRRKTREAFTSGQESRAINSANTVTGHLVGLSHAIDQLDNTGFDWVNGPAQALGSHFGNKATQKALGDFGFYKTAVANELTKVFRGSGGAEADIQAWVKQLDSAKSPVELHATVNSMVEGMMSRLDALGEQYSQGMGKTTDPLDLLSPHARKALATLQSGQIARTDPPSGAVQLLQQNPQYATAFDAKYGAGSSRRYLGGR